MNNNCLNNYSCFPENRITVNNSTIKLNTKNIIAVAGSPVYIYLPIKANVGDVFTVQNINATPSGNPVIKQNAGQKIIASRNIGILYTGIKKETTVGTSGNLTVHGGFYPPLEFTFVCIERNTVFLSLSYSGTGMFNGSKIV